MHYIRALIFFGAVALPVCTQGVTNYVDIRPRTENNIYQMKVNGTVVFQAKAFQKDDTSGSITAAALSKVWWAFDKQLLQKTKATEHSITLTAIKSGVCNLTLRGIVNNQIFEKNITVLIKN
jgi:hypothetical protein